MEKEKRTSGFLLITRGLMNNPLWTKKPATWFKIWIYILEKVNWEDHQDMQRGEGYFNFTRERERIGIDITPDIIKKSIDSFRKMDMISTSRSTRGMKIKVLNYNKYQTLDNYLRTTPSTREAREKHERSTPIIKDNKTVSIAAEAASGNFNQNTYIDGMRKNKAAHIRLLGWYFTKRGSFFPDEKTIHEEIKRWLKDASFIVKYPQENIAQAHLIAVEKHPEMWNLHTIRKIISETKI